MKKILLATTMLAGTAGFAAAEVKLSGYAEIGVASNNAGDVQFWQDVDVTFSMSGTTDGGLEFGTSVDLDETDYIHDDDINALDESTDDNGYSVYVSGTFGKITMGDTDGALDWAVQDADGLTSIADDHTTHVAFFGAGGLDGEGDGQIVRYENTFGGVSFAVSAEQDNDGAAGNENIRGVGVKYTADMGGTALNLGLGYQSYIDDNAVGVSVGAEFAGGFSGMIGYVSTDRALAGADTDHLGLAVKYTTGALSLQANYGQIDHEVGATEDSFGVAVNYDLGGGAVVMAGYGSDTSTAAGSQDQWSVGLGLSF